MDVRQLSQPIVVAKPVRGREMQSTSIPKDMVETIRAVSAKPIEQDSVVQSLQKPREGDVEVFHEGYISGKLYLVPDGNLQAMRDIVNLKMRPRHSSAAKPQTSLDEQIQYIEFTSKLDTLQEKIGQLADSSLDGDSYETASVEGSEKSNVDVITETKQSLDKSMTSSTLSEDSKETMLTSLEKKKKRNQSFLQSITDENSRKSYLSSISEDSKTNHLNLEKGHLVPPILNENIKYIRVKSKEPNKNEKVTDSSSGLYLQKEKNENIKKKKERLKLEPNTLERSTIDRFYGVSNGFSKKAFKLLISGHLKNGVTPLFLVHENFAMSSILDNYVPDFKTHRQEGNIDIFISGKFFTEDILLEESPQSPAVLNIKPQKVYISKGNNLQRNKFKDIYNFGPIDIVLEGDFKKDKKKMKYTPILSLEILKSTSFKQNNNFRKMINNKISKSSQSLKSNLKQNKVVILNDSDKEIPRNNSISSKQKHVHYANKSEKKVHENKQLDKHFKLKNILDFFKRNEFFNIISIKTKNSSFGENETLKKESISHETKKRLYKSRKEELAKCRQSRLMERKSYKDKTKTKPDVKIKEVKLNAVVKINQANKESKSSLFSKEVIKESAQNESLVTQKLKKIKNKDKNQAIVENPILAQMEEFFIA